MKLIDFISKLSAIAARSGADAEVLIETGNLNHIGWEFDIGTKNVVILKLDMSNFAEAQAELQEATAEAKAFDEPLGGPSRKSNFHPSLRCHECGGNIEECDCEPDELA